MNRRAINNFFLLIPHFFLYIFCIVISMDTAKDRDNYLIFYTTPETSRFEYLFVQIGLFLKYIGIEPFYGLLFIQILAILLFFISFVRLIPKESIFAFPILMLLFFSVFSTILGMQLRFGFSISLALFIFSIVKNKTSIYQILYIVPILIHTGIIPFIISLIVYKFKKKIKRLYFFFIVILSTIIMTFLTTEIPTLFELDPYYTQYFTTNKSNPSTISLFLIFYFLIIFINFYFSFKRRFEWIGYFGIIFSITSIFTGVALWLKFMMPFVLLSTIELSKNIALYKFKYGNIIFAILYTISFLSFIYFSYVLEIKYI